jgi:choline dehydrogenase-like flavoprotein
LEVAEYTTLLARPWVEGNKHVNNVQNQKANRLTSSALNDMIFHRTNKGAYETWANMVGDSTFTWDNFLPYLKKSVKFTPPNLEMIGPNVSIPYDPSVYSPTGGPLEASFPNFRPAFDQFMATAFDKTGFKMINGLNSGHLDGYAPTTLALSAEYQTRSSSEASFLQRALDNTPLRLYLRTLAKKILFDDEKKATGVLVETNGADYVISAAKEVIVSSGVVSTQVFMISYHMLICPVPLSPSFDALGYWARRDTFAVQYPSDLRSCWCWSEHGGIIREAILLPATYG